MELFVRTCRAPNERDEDGWHDMPALLLGRATLRLSLQAEDDRRGGKLSGAEATEGRVPRMRCRFGRRLPEGPHAGSARQVSSVHTFTVAALNNDGPTECRVSLPTSEKSMECPVEGCRGRATRTPRANLRVRILHTGTPVTLWSCSRRDRSHAPSVTSVKAPQPRDVQAGS